MIDKFRLIELRSTVERLNAAADGVRLLIAEAEKDLSGVAVEAWVSIPGGSLGYRAFSKGWFLAFEPEDGNTVRLTDAPRVVRIEALVRINDLVGAINQRVRELIAVAAKAVEKGHP